MSLISKEKMRALKILAILHNSRNYCALLPEVLGAMEAGVHVSISDILIQIQDLKSAAFISQSGSWLSLTEKGRPLAAKIANSFNQKV